MGEAWRAKREEHRAEFATALAEVSARFDAIRHDTRVVAWLEQLDNTLGRSPKWRTQDEITIKFPVGAEGARVSAVIEGLEQVANPPTPPELPQAEPLRPISWTAPPTAA
jgi:hypothetical protein